VHSPNAGHPEPLPEETWRQQPREISDELVANLGACLAAVRSATLAELAEAAGMAIPDVRLALRRLAEQLERAGMQVLDDSSQFSWCPTDASTVPSRSWCSPSDCLG
jgi:hypothetical protein